MTVRRHELTDREWERLAPYLPFGLVLSDAAGPIERAQGLLKRMLLTLRRRQQVLLRLPLRCSEYRLCRRQIDRPQATCTDQNSERRETANGVITPCPAKVAYYVVTGASGHSQGQMA